MKEEEIVLEDNALFSLISAYRLALKTMKKKIHQVKAKAQSIGSRILEIRDRLVVGTRVAMSELLDNAGQRRQQVLITFLSLLELGKMGFVSLYQTDNFEEIYIDTKQVVETNVVERVEEYDSMRADEIAAAMMEKAQKVSSFEELDAEEDLMSSPQNQLSFVDDKDDSDEIVESQEDLATDEEILQAEKDLETENSGEMNV
jgi:segregation and condensation protein A